MYNSASRLLKSHKKSIENLDKIDIGIQKKLNKMLKNESMIYKIVD